MTKTTAEPGAVASTRDGLAVLRPEAVALRTALEERFLRWAVECGAQPTLYPPLMRVTDLHRLDYFQNFPHLAILGAELTTTAAEEASKGVERAEAIPATALTDARYALPSAACYNIYLDLGGTELTDTRRVTTVATCFRRENKYDGLRRLLGFSMREIVCVGEREAVLDHLRTFKQKVGEYLAAIELPTEVQVASDPFYDNSASRSVMAQLFPVKEEFVFDGSLAIASVNFHRNFFGERCEIRTADGTPAFSGCVAFGIERWISALTTRFPDRTADLVDRILAA